jgi:DNA-binding transcriptional regulator YhcF (GntR family)
VYVHHFFVGRRTNLAFVARMQRTGRQVVLDTLRDRIVTGIHVGRYKGGERLPGVRQLATDFDVNERVVLAALRALTEEGFVELRPRSGAYIVPPHPGSGADLPHLSAWLITTLIQARTRGLAPIRLPEYVRRSLQTRRFRAACIECNEDQLHLLCSELADDHGFITESVRLDEIKLGAPPMALLRADLLVTTAFHTDRVRRIATALDKAWFAVDLRADVMRAVAERLRHGPVYFVAIDPHFERKIRRILGAFGPTTNLRVLIVDRDDVRAIPADAPTFVMSSARERLRRRGVSRIPGRPIQPPRHFSDESARELLSFLVRRNMDALARMSMREHE